MVEIIITLTNNKFKIMADDKFLVHLIDKLKNDELIKVGDIIFNKSQFVMLETKYQKEKRSLWKKFKFLKRKRVKE